MTGFFPLLAGTFILRPYVFAFLLVYFLGCSFQFGLRRAGLFCVLGYLTAWLSEYSSIHNGFPYGFYYYIEATRGKELWVGGVPFMDSLSYVFLAYASYSLALVALGRIRRSRNFGLDDSGVKGSFSARALGALLFVYLDIIIDPVALRGDRWFLGRIYGYPDGGAYFGIPISNFIGWLITGFVMIWIFQLIGKVQDKKSGPWWGYIFGPALYLSVLAFNLFMTFHIGEYGIGFTGLFLYILPAALFYILVKKNRSALVSG